jgi:hypothetical protein
MRIEPTGIPQLPPGAPAPRSGAKAADAAAPVADSGAFAPSADLAALLSAVKQAPDVRAEVIEAAAAQLAEGAFATPEAAADAAKALLDSGDAQ